MWINGLSEKCVTEVSAARARMPARRDNRPSGRRSAATAVTNLTTNRRLWVGNR
jgi:hypothetical protein